MNERLILYFLACGPFVLTLAAWTRIYLERQRERPSPIALVALGITSANALFAVVEVLRLEFRPLSQLPPWQDPQILALAMLFLLAPIGMIAGLISLARGASAWLVCIVEIASAPLLVLGFFASGSV